MLKLRNKEQKTMYEEEIEHVLMSMAYEAPDSEEYKRMSEALERIMKYAPEKRCWRPSPDTMLSGAVSIVSIAMVLTAELAFDKILTSKSVGFISKIRV